MNLAGLLLILAAHYLCGRGILAFFGKERAARSLCLSFIIGVFIVSLVPCILQLLNITINATSVASGIAVVTLLFCVPLFKKLKRPAVKWPTLPALYEWPFIITILLLALVSVWRCFYYPPIARDMLTGPELLAEYTVREGTMLNSVYSIDLTTTNNYFKSPFITGLQIVYKLLVCPFGQLWLSVLFVSFTVWFYALLRNRLHRLLAGFLALLFVATPTMYGYTYVMLYDYSNMVFFLLGYYFFMIGIDSEKRRELLFASFLFGIATYIRTETLVFVIMLLPLLLFYMRSSKLPTRQIVTRSFLFVIIPIACYMICMNVFIRNFVPVHFDLHSQFNTDFRDVSMLYNRLLAMAQLIFSPDGITIYGFIIMLFFTILLIDLIWLRKFSPEAVMLLYGIAIIFIGYAILGYLFPAVVDMANTTKRGLFKAIALMTLYFSVSNSMLRLTEFISRFEMKFNKVQS